MRKIFLFITMIAIFFLVNGISTEADTITYNFDSITIKSAYTFDVECTQLPLENSFLYGYVVPNDTLHVYIGALEFMLNGNPVEASPYIMIITTEDGTDVARWLINGHDYTGRYTFSSHITIDPTKGVVKTTEESMDATILNHSELIDNAGTTYYAIPNTYQTQDNVEIVLSMYQE